MLANILFSTTILEGRFELSMHMRGVCLCVCAHVCVPIDVCEVCP